MPYINSDTGQYPISEAEIREAHPNVLFPHPFVPPEPYALVFAAPQPALKPWQGVREGAPMLTDKGHYEQSWQAVEPADPVAALADLKEQRKAAATAKRWEVQTGGITLPNGVRVLTGDLDITRVDQAITNMARYNIASIDFKAASGWVTLSLSDMTAAGQAIAAHQQACFSAERTHHEAIDALTTLDAVLAHDITSGWPV